MTTKGISLISSKRFVSYFRVKLSLNGIKRFKSQLNILTACKESSVQAIALGDWILLLDW